VKTVSARVSSEMINRALFSIMWQKSVHDQCGGADY
jgi:hypothetical protein